MSYIRRAVSIYAQYDLRYAIVFTPKYKRRVLIDDVRLRLEQIIREICNELYVEIMQLDVISDRVIMFIKPPPNIPPHHIVNRIKYWSGSTLRKEFPKLKTKLPALWSRAYYCATIGEFSEDIAHEFCLQQKKPYR